MKVFVISEFGDPFDQIFEDLRGYFKREKVLFTRADSERHSISIIKKIVDDINSSDIIIADLTNDNPNVFWELGVAHTLAKPTIHITQSIESAPFDLKGYNLIEYGISFYEFKELRSTLKEMLREFDKGKLKTGNPVIDHLGANPGVTETSITKQDELEVEDDTLPQGLIEVIDILLNDSDSFATSLEELTLDVSTFSSNVEMITSEMDAQTPSDHLRVQQMKSAANRVGQEISLLADSFSSRRSRIETSTIALKNYGLVLAEFISTSDEPLPQEFNDAILVYIQLSSSAGQAVLGMNQMVGQMRHIRTLSSDLRKPIDKLSREIKKLETILGAIVAIGERLSLLVESRLN